ncbi:MAG TPA: SWIM zinc finger family protein [Bryobacteraceae bacterium]|nr:SWIM zinc finger family protein [Bryobacteraceae bacterium]
MHQPQNTSRAAGERLVVSRTDEGFRVYSASEPSRSYIVSGSPEQPSCTCPDFQHHNQDPDWRCKHILAVLDVPVEDEPYDSAERDAIQNEVPATEPAQMVLKRSVSPDGRIDSLSVEFSVPVDHVSASAIKARAMRSLELQSEIVESFLSANGNGHGPSSNNGAGASANAPAPARMLAIGGINTKWGRRLYLGIEAGGQTLKFFGNRKQLAEAISAAGYPNLAERIEEGVRIDKPCRAVTKPSEDGRYVNVEQLLPANSGGSRRWS